MLKELIAIMATHRDTSMYTSCCLLRLNSLFSSCSFQGTTVAHVYIRDINRNDACTHGIRLKQRLIQTSVPSHASASRINETNIQNLHSTRHMQKTIT
jgi:hypothetical protein